jgi:hypothetical protein
MTTLPMLPDVGRMIESVCPLRADESEFIERVKTLLGDRLKHPDQAMLEQVEAEFRQFRAWARAFGYRELPAHGAVVAGYLMAIMNEIGCLNQVREAGRAVASVHAARGLYLDDRYLKAAVAWAKDFRAGGERL